MTDEQIDAMFEGLDLLKPDWRDTLRARLRANLASCQHQIVDARNSIVKSGYLCVDCGAVFAAADHDGTPPQASADDAELSRLREENAELAKFVIAVGGFWGHSKSVLIGETSLAACIQGAFEDSEKVARYQRMNGLLHKIIKIRVEETNRLKARVAELEMLAKRYQWLREGGQEQEDMFGSVWGDSLDKQIDAALAAERADKEGGV